MELNTAAGTVDVGFPRVVEIAVGILDMLSVALGAEGFVREDGLIEMTVVGFALEDCAPPDEAGTVADAVGIGIESVLVSVNLGIELDDEAGELPIGSDEAWTEVTDDRSEIVVDDGAMLFVALPGAVWLFRFEDAALVTDTGAEVLAPAWELGCAPEVGKRVLGLLNSGIDDGFAGPPFDVAEVGAAPV